MLLLCSFFLTLYKYELFFGHELLLSAFLLEPDVFVYVLRNA